MKITSNKKLIPLLMVIVLIAITCTILVLKSRSALVNSNAPAGIALAVAKAVYSNDAGSLERIFADGKDRRAFVSQVSEIVQKYGAVKEVVLLSNDRVLSLPDGTGMSAGPKPGMSTWKVVAEHESYILGIYTQNGRLACCCYNLGMPVGGFVTGTM